MPETPSYRGGLRHLDAADILRILKKNRFIFIISMMVGILISLYIIQKRPPVYQARTSIELRAVPEITEAIFGGDIPSRIKTEIMIIKSRPVLVLALKEVGLIPTAMTMDEITVDERYIDLVKEFESSLMVRDRKGSSIINIFVKSTDPQRARDLANALVESYTEYHKVIADLGNKETTDFVMDQKKILEGELNKVEERIKWFKRQENIIQLGPEISMSLKRVQTLKQKKGNIKKKIERLQEIIGGLPPPERLKVINLYFINITSLGLEGLKEYRDDLIRLIDRRDELLKTYTPRHPLILENEEKIAGARTKLLENMERFTDILKGQSVEIDEEIQRLNRLNLKFIEKESRLKRLNSQVLIIRNMISTLENEEQQRRLRSLLDIGKINVIEPAFLPRTPMKDISYRIIFVGLVLGFTFGVALSFLKESLDYSLTVIREVEEFTGHKILGMIPHFSLDSVIKGKKNGISIDDPRKSAMVVQYWPDSMVAESFRNMTVNLIKVLNNGNIFLITSAIPREGKSFISTNLAISFSQNGYNTLLVETDMRRSSFHKVFGLKRSPGLIDLIQGQKKVDEVLRGVEDILASGMDLYDIERTPGLDNLHIILAGRCTSHQSESLFYLTNTQFFEEIKERFDVVILDCAAAVPIADSNVLARQSDHILMVYRMGKTPKDLLSQAFKGITEGKNILGVVLSDVDIKTAYSYPGYHYKYYGYYGHDTPHKSKLAALLSRFPGISRFKKS